MTRKKGLPAAVGLVAITACIMAVGLWIITSEAEPWCFTFEIRLMIWGPFVCLMAGFIGALVLAMRVASLSAYLLIAVTSATMAALSYAVGMLGFTCMPVAGPTEVFAVAMLVLALAIVAAGVGAIPGFLLGRFVVWRRGQLD